MENTLESQLATVVEKALQVAEQTGEFVIDQAPELLREFYLWHIIDSSIGIFFYTVVIYIIYRVVKYFGVRDDWDFDDGSLIASAWIGGILGLWSLFAIYWNISQLLQIWLAPKYFLIEQFIN